MICCANTAEEQGRLLYIIVIHLNAIVFVYTDFNTVELSAIVVQTKSTFCGIYSRLSSRYKNYVMFLL